MSMGIIALQGGEDVKEMLHHVAIYGARPSIFQKDRLELVATREFETPGEAAGVFESLR